MILVTWNMFEFGPSKKFVNFLGTKFKSLTYFGGLRSYLNLEINIQDMSGELMKDSRIFCPL